MVMCNMSSVSSRSFVPLEISHKGERHKLHELVQESQQDSETGMAVESFV